MKTINSREIVKHQDLDAVIRRMMAAENKRSMRREEGIRTAIQLGFILLLIGAVLLVAYFPLRG